MSGSTRASGHAQRWLAALLLCAGSALAQDTPPKLIFQTDQVWSPRVNVGADMVLAYGLDDSLASRIADWRAHGYRVGFMTGVAWGHYPDYLDGRFDGATHWQETQQATGGELLLHTGRDTPYLVPTTSYQRYLDAGIVRALEAGADAVYLEEPEFWARAGWSDAFKQAWSAYYNAPWQPPDSSVQAQYMASRLKALLYREVITSACATVHDWARAHQRQVPCNVATHSLLNYAQWQIVSPENDLLSLDIDGFIGQVWTGTARAPNVYRGKQDQRTFETAFLEFGALQRLADAAGKPIWMLSDPVEDNPNHNWTDYQTNWQATVVASLLHPGSARYEILPWPNRIFDLDADYPLATGARATIPRDYQIVLQTVFDALGRMPAQDGAAPDWMHAGTPGIGVLTSNTLMFQRAPPNGSDPWLGDVHGLAMPLLMRGIPVTPVPMEASYLGPAPQRAFANYRVLLLSYHGQTSPSPAFDLALVDWVRHGGALVVIDDDGNPCRDAAPRGAGLPLPGATRAQLFAALGLPADASGTHRVGAGVVVALHAAPALLAQQASGADTVLQATRQAATAIGLHWSESPALVLRRGPYVIAAGLDDGDSEHATTTPLPGHYIDLFDPALALRTAPAIAAGEHRLLLDLDRIDVQQPTLLAASGRSSTLQVDGANVRFSLSGIAGRDGDHAVAALALPTSPRAVLVNGTPLPADAWSYADHVLRLRLPASAQALSIQIEITAAH